MKLMSVTPDYAAADCALEALGLLRVTSNPKRATSLGDVAAIQLSQGLEALVDMRDAPVVTALNWCAYRQRVGVSPYAVTTVRRLDGSTTALRLHRFLMRRVEKDGSEIDHIDGDSLNNRRENLRVCSHAQNLCNRGLMRSNTSGFKGVYLDRLSGRWRAEIVNNGRRHRLGYFETAEQAAEAYDEAAKRLHDKFARTNEMMAA